MNWLILLRHIIKPIGVSCNQNAHQQSLNLTGSAYSGNDEEGSKKYEKIVSYQHFYGPIQAVTDNPQMIRGFKFEVGLPLSPYFQVINTWNFPNTGTLENSLNPLMPAQSAKPSFTLCLHHVQNMKSNSPVTVMMGKIDNDGKMQGIVYRKLTDSISLKLTGSFQSSNIAQGLALADMQISGKKYQSSIRIAENYFGFSHMSKIHKNLLLGFQYANYAKLRSSYFGYGAKLYFRNHEIYGKYSHVNSEYNIGYLIPIKKDTSFVSNFSYDLSQRKTLTTLGFRQSYSNSNITASINTRGLINTCLSIKSTNFSLKLCGMVDFANDKYNFGYGVTLGQIS